MPGPSSERKLPAPRMPLRLVRLHFHLLLSIAIGGAVTIAVAATDLRLPTRLLAGWDVGVVCYLVLTLWVMGHASIDEIRRRASMQDEGAFVLPLLMAGAAIASLIAVVAELGNATSGAAWDKLALGMGTVVLSWLFMHTIFALHYAYWWSRFSRQTETRLLGFPLLLLRHRHDFVSVRRSDHQ
jgi:uncharacterized membrane protein